MPTRVIENIRDIIADEMPVWCWFSNPAAEAINRSTLQFRLGCKDPQLPHGRRQRRLRIDLTKELVEQVAAATDSNARDGALNAIRREISWYFQQLHVEPRFTEWLLTEDIIPNAAIAPALVFTKRRGRPLPLVGALRSEECGPIDTYQRRTNKK